MPAAAGNDYTYRVHTSQILIVLQVHSAGYEASAYVCNPQGEPERPFVEQISVRELIRVLARRNPSAAHAVAAVVANRAALRADEVLGEVLGKVRSWG